MKLFIDQADKRYKVIILEEVELSDKIMHVKHMIQEKRPTIPVYRQMLQLDGKELEDNHRLVDYGISNQSKINLTLLKPAKIIIETTDNRSTIELNLEKLRTGKDISKEIENRLLIPISKQRLSFDGVRVNEEELNKLDIVNDSVFQMDIKQPRPRCLLSLTVKTSNKSSVHLDWISRHASVEYLKERLIAMLGIGVMRKSLFYENVLLEDDQLIKNYFTIDNAKLELRDNVKSDRLKIFVKTPDQISSEHLLMTIDPNESIEMIKMRIKEINEHKNDISIVKMKLFYNELHLKDHRTLAYYNIEQNSIIRLVVLIVINILKSKKKEIKLSVDSSCNVEDIKYQIQELKGFPVSQQKLEFNGKTLENERTIRRYGIHNKSTLELTWNRRIRVFVRLTTGRSLLLTNLKSSDTIKSLKEKIQTEHGIQADSQILTDLDVLPMLDGHTLDYYEIENNSIIYLRSKLDCHLSINILGTKTVNMEVSVYETVDDLKERIEDQEGIPSERQALFNDKGIEFGLFSHHNSGDTIHLTLKMKITIKNAAGHEIKLNNVLSTDTVAKLRTRIRGHLAICNQQKLSFYGLKLDENVMLREYNIGDGSTILIDSHTCGKCASCLPPHQNSPKRHKSSQS